jgi:acetyl esterase/lipase
MSLEWNAGTAYLCASLWGAAFSAAALIRARRLGPLVAAYFFAAWLSSELALFHIAWQAAATLAFAAAGAFTHAEGLLGLAITAISWVGLLAAQRRARPAAAVFESALVAALGLDYRGEIPSERRALLRDATPPREWLRPFSMRRPGVRVIRNLAYGDAGIRHQLDLYLPEAPGLLRPLLLQIHGGAWVYGQKEQQALPLLYHLTSRGWICAAVNYRLSPGVRFPEQLIDLKRALAWLRAHALAYGGDPDFIAVTGGSAGGHLSSLVALTPNRAELQPGFESEDTRVQAAVPFYGIYDFLDREKLRGSQSMEPFLEKFVMPGPAATRRDVWELASPISHVSDDAPPFFVIHGSHDSLAWVEDARVFSDALRKHSRQPVAFAEVPGAQHAFDTFHSERSAHTVNAVARFLEWSHARWRAQR